MSKFITITIVKDSEEGLEQDLPVTINSHYIVKVMKSTEDEHGNTAIMLATGEFLFVHETKEDIDQALRS
jgi:hypothetical protein